MAFRSGARDVFRLAPLGFPALARPELILLWWMTWADPIFFIRVTDIRTEDGISALLPTASIKGVATNGFCRLTRLKFHFDLPFHSGGLRAPGRDSGAAPCGSLNLCW